MMTINAPGASVSLLNSYPRRWDARQLPPPPSGFPQDITQGGPHTSSFPLHPACRPMLCPTTAADVSCATTHSCLIRGTLIEGRLTTRQVPTPPPARVR
ncbi:uncharacterized protein B0I36DRAFT_312551 [Microdochium trichocladiopsis]|uniref:Uncharacterized protein n=1 Tax=Microdochium trichocladiopsis TaxID=1682393 RepID=A0A9P8YJS5_9PEZI|nr:uncharacterized protein B0I36DRAFT_312551 [Microdochium trichocladiopsis]KAH7041303.1 hypothetical protein B0I36DRAFT_312551 [Microdochium trichocladiopsis]